MPTSRKSERSSLNFFEGGPSSLNLFMVAVPGDSRKSSGNRPIRRVSFDNSVSSLKMAGI